ncbi:ER-golgi trafficking TRAPP I complex 85 kDa subunit-domain-containing protein [Hypoxylon argillaceum]|nr:ER-golgi trafficking TRAPP I complex 85 kDa subunit-domain-containing protein [Hypoxylon argillaceum]
MQPFDHNAPTKRVSTPPMAASALRNSTIKTRQSLGETSPLSQSEFSLPYRRSHPSAASLYASTFSPPGSRSQSPVGRPLSTRTTSGSVFGVGPNNGLALAAGGGGSPGDPLNLILHAFAPHVAIYTSEDTDILLKEKGFDRGLWELLRPFGERIQGKVIIRDSNGSSRVYEDYSLHFTQFGEGIVHPEPIAAGLKSPTGSGPNGASGRPNEPARPSNSGTTIAEVEAVVDRHLTYAEESFFGMPHSPTNHGFGIDESSPYYALYLRRLLSGLPLTPHETFAHPVACVTAISSRNQAPIETLRRLYTESSTGERRLPSWVDGEFLRYYVLVHDEERDDITRSMSLFDQMKRNLGLHCHLLRVRGSRSLATDDDSIPLPRCEWMSAVEELVDLRNSEDHEGYEDPTKYIFESDATAIRTFIREMVTQSIIPTMERHVSVWNDQVASRRRGLAGRFVGLTRRWGFGSNSRSSVSGSSSGSNYDSLGFYRSDTPEAIMRKLADYAFMLRDWKLAYSTYDILRGDFNNDKAWRYHAATNEMAALSLLIMPQNLSSKTRAETIDAMFEAAYYSYLTRCSTPYGALRCLSFGLELLRLRGGSSIDDAARWGIRLLESKILGPVGDALIKERLAVCYASKEGIGTQAWGSRRRKSALWNVLGAETWLAQSKFIQAQRCLNEARKTYSDLPTDYGINKFSHAGAFMLNIGQELNENMERADQGEDETADEESETVDEESEALGGGRRRAGSLGFPSGAGTANLESAPLRSQMGAGKVEDTEEGEDEEDEDEEDKDDEEEDEDEDEEDEDEDEDEDEEEDEEEDDDDDDEDEDDEDEDEDEEAEEQQQKRQRGREQDPSGAKDDFG